MMREVINDGDAVHLRLNFQAPLHALERLQRRHNLLFRDAVPGSQRRCRGCIPHVVFARQRELKIHPGSTVVQHGPRSASRRQFQVSDSPVRVPPCAIALHGAKRLAQAALEADAFTGAVRHSIESHNPSPTRNQIYQTLERGLDSIEILVNIGVIELHRSQDHCLRKVMQKLWSLVEQRRIVLVAFQNEMHSLAQMETRSKVFRNPSDEKRRLHPRRVKNPRQHRGRRGLSVRSRHHQHFLVQQEFLMQQLRQRTEGYALVERLLYFDIPPRNRIAYHNQIRTRLEISRIEGLGHRNPELRQEIRHGRIRRGIRAGHAKPPLRQHASQRRHRRPANTDQMNVLVSVHAFLRELRLHFASFAISSFPPPSPPPRESSSSPGRRSPSTRSARRSAA